MSYRVEVQPDGVRRLATAFSSEACDLGVAVASFRSRAGDVEEAFGVLGPSTELYHEYLALTRDSVTGLEELEQALEQAGAALRATAANYSSAEAASAIAPSGGGGTSGA